MAHHGHHCRGELEFFNPRWAETPDYILSIVKNYMMNLGSTDSLADYRKSAEEREQLTQECRTRLKNPLKRMIFDLLLAKSQQGLSLREMVKSEAVRQIACMRQLYLELGRIFASQNILELQEDIFFLHVEELESIHRRAAAFDVKEMISQRRRDYEKHLAITPCPIVIGTRDEKKRIPCEVDETIDMLNGVAVSSGIARGPARVITSKNESAPILPGEILVIPFADPGWSLHFIPSAGIVTDMGGMLSHGSIIAREYGIPTVVNVGFATKIIKTGQTVEVDGNCGTVRVIKQCETS